MAVATLPTTDRAFTLRQDTASRLEPFTRVPQAEVSEIRVPGLDREVVVKLASEPSEWEEAFELVTANYQKRGYELNQAKAYRFTQYHALPDTAVFVAKCEGRVIATLSLVADNDLLGLPLEALYGEEVEAKRREGRRIAEVTSLAMADLTQREFLQVFLTMIRLLWQYHLSQGGDTIVIAVNPRHAAFYQRVIGGEPLGPRRPYAAVSNAPAEAYWFEPVMMLRNAPKSHNQIFGNLVPAEALRPQTMPRPFVHYFGSESTQAETEQFHKVLSTVANSRVRRW